MFKITDKFYWLIPWLSESPVERYKINWPAVKSDTFIPKNCIQPFKMTSEHICSNGECIYEWHENQYFVIEIRFQTQWMNHFGSTFTTDTLSPSSLKVVKKNGSLKMEMGLTQCVRYLTHPAAALVKRIALHFRIWLFLWPDATCAMPPTNRDKNS